MVEMETAAALAPTQEMAAEDADLPEPIPTQELRASGSCPVEELTYAGSESICPDLFRCRCTFEDD